MSRSAAQWLQQPKLPQSHFVDSRIYTDETIFREEQQKVFNKSWIIACHESELPGAFDYRTFSHPGGTP
ncbi:MAG: aromatic ring-hydroxylating dioxygenase subunit alpha, partial [Pseudomonadota bacterium]|nr:aromatic ring-hydroxylating dioxygenase subunit alpha [Pseudomonadota bacterium]